MELSSTAEMVLRNLRKITRSIDIHSNRLKQSHGMTGPQVYIMQEIAKSGSIQIGSLAQKVSLSHATVTGILNRLEKQALIARARDHHDKRRILVSLTGKGEEILRNSPPLLQEQFLSAFEKLAEWEQLQILSSLQRVANLMDAEKLEAAPLLESGSIIPTDPAG